MRNLRNMIFDVDKPGIIEYTTARKLIHSSLIIRYLRETQVKCWNRPVTISPVPEDHPSRSLVSVRWSAGTDQLLYHRTSCMVTCPVSSEGEVLEQTSYYITSWSEKHITIYSLGEVLEQTSYYITHEYDLICDGAPGLVKCWNRPVTISPQVIPWFNPIISGWWSAGTDQLLYHQLSSDTSRVDAGMVKCWNRPVTISPISIYING